MCGKMTDFVNGVEWLWGGHINSVFVHLHIIIVSSALIHTAAPAYSYVSCQWTQMVHFPTKGKSRCDWVLVSSGKCALYTFCNKKYTHTVLIPEIQNRCQYIPYQHAGGQALAFHCQTRRRMFWHLGNWTLCVCVCGLGSFQVAYRTWEPFLVALSVTWRMIGQKEDIMCIQPRLCLISDVYSILERRRRENKESLFPLYSCAGRIDHTKATTEWKLNVINNEWCIN